MRIKNYWRFINENLKTEIESELKADENKDLKAAVVEKIIKSLNTDERKVFEEFIDAYISDSSKNQIQGLINNADIYEFYLKYRNQVDSLLSAVKFYDEEPSELNSFGLYDFLVKGTQRAIKECVLMIKEDLKNKESQSGQSQSEKPSEG